MPDDDGGQSVEQQHPKQNPDVQAINPPLSPKEPTPITATPISADPNRTQIELLEDRMRSAEKWMVWLTGAIAFFGLCTVVVGALQWGAMKGQLGEMQSGGVDTHALAVSAGKQADAAKSQVDKMAESIARTDKLVGATAELAQEAKRSAEVSQKALRATIAADRPWIGLSEASFGDIGKTKGANFFFLNSGRRPALIVLSNMQYAFYDTLPAHPGYGPRLVPPSSGLVMPNGGFNMPTSLPFTDWSQVEAIPAPKRLFVYARVEYEDIVTHERHWTHACFVHGAAEAIKTVNHGFVDCEMYNDAR